MNVNRRSFLRRATQLSIGVGVASLLHTSAVAQSGRNRNRQLTAREFLRSMLCTREGVDLWLAGKAFPFAKYSSEFGWLLPNAYFRDGVDKSTSVYTYHRAGCRWTRPRTSRIAPYLSSHCS